jgi:hypothetical protein
MWRFIGSLSRLMTVPLILCAGAFAPALAASGCDEEAKWSTAGSQRHFVVLAGRSGVFYERSGPAFVLLMKATAEETAAGAIGIYAGDSKQPVFGAVPTSAYQDFLRESQGPADVMLRVEINGPQYERALKVMQSWDRRAREGALLYPNIALDNILLVKQVAEELNRCTPTLAGQPLDWGLDDAISENNSELRIPYEYFKELKRLNVARHVPDARMPVALLPAADLKDKE